ncbi:hypothetical protein AAL_03942 [Moelleriella libera RCEF 2490]|uniref:Uncharacterized protein n=1 Tax=Moelleriella libera RCEF 2490 TaxID=1081109 RepID=A0A162IQ82_9HYPO|nr:hypothetical protein AAL_03942 [Moelleriella libera RCEF 2490]
MPRFPFSRSGRRKQPHLPLVDAPPMSKAHKILGSTPLSIDQPGGREDHSSDVFTDVPSTNSAVTCREELDLRSDKHGYRQGHVQGVEDEWEEHSDAMSLPMRLNALGFPVSPDTTPLETVTRVRRSRSTSIIRSWYDKTKMPLSISQQTSSSAMAKGPPIRAHPGLGPVLEETMRTKKRPTRLDLSLTHSKARVAPEMVPTSGPMADLLFSSTSSTPSSPLSAPYHEPGGPSRGVIQRAFHSPDAGVPRPRTSCSNRLVSGASHAPSLYDHYEQMSVRHVLRQSSTPNLKAEDQISAQALEGASDVEIDDSQGHVAHALPKTPTTAVPAKVEYVWSPGDGARSISSRHTKDSKLSGASKSTKASLEGTDLLQNSVLILSSDSESDDFDADDADDADDDLYDDNDDNATPSILSPTAATIREATNHAASNIQPDMITSQRCPPQRTTSLVRQHLGVDPFSTGVRAPVSQHAENGRSTSTSDASVSEAPHVKASTTDTSPRSSVISGCSSISGVTGQDDPACDIQEARAITVLAARRPSDVDMGNKMAETPSAANNRCKSASRMKSPLPPRVSSTDQPTPPLSPSSMDFYIRSAHTSVDGFGSQSRLMVVTHQEEKLLSALRQKQQTVPFPAPSEKESDVSRPDTAIKREEEEFPRRSDKAASHGHQSQGSQTTITGATFDFGFPAPPSFRASNAPTKFGTEGQRPAVAPIRTSGLSARSRLVPSSPAGPPPTLSLPELPKHRSFRPSSSLSSKVITKDVPLYFDDSEPSPDLDDIRDWELATSPVVDTTGPRSSQGTMWRNVWSHPRGNENDSDSLALSPRQPRPRFGEDVHDIYDCEEAPTHEYEDIPRPDSPVSPDVFPDPSTGRLSCTNVARLSAVGTGL